VNEKHPRAIKLMKAQENAANRAEFQGNVAFVGTKAFWRESDAAPSKQSYHWNSSGATYFEIGDAMGKAMLKLCGKGK
jgi:alpha-galactosidase